MKTFEERYTAWIDGQLTGDALTAFELELARRAEAGDAEAAETDRAQALGLRALLKEHLRAPALTNTEFFSHQMRERIDAEIDRAARRREAASGPAWRFPAFAWPFARLAGAGVVCLFVAGALYYGMMPAHQPQPSASIAEANNPPPLVTPGALVKNDPVVPPMQDPADRPKSNDFARLDTPIPTPLDLSSGEDIHVVQPNPASTTSATTLHYDKASVLWLNNPPYLPNVAGANPSPAPAANLTPAPSAAPSVVP